MVVSPDSNLVSAPHAQYGSNDASKFDRAYSVSISDHESSIASDASGFSSTSVDSSGVIIVYVSETPSFLHLPDESLLLVLSFLSVYELCSASAVCQHLRSICLHRKLWESLLVRDFDRDVSSQFQFSSVVAPRPIPPVVSQSALQGAQVSLHRVTFEYSAQLLIAVLSADS